MLIILIVICGSINSYTEHISSCFKNDRENPDPPTSGRYRVGQPAQGASREIRLGNPMWSVEKRNKYTLRRARTQNPLLWRNVDFGNIWCGSPQPLFYGGIVWCEEGSPEIGWRCGRDRVFVASTEKGNVSPHENSAA